jgi:hypothetical protein
MMTIVRVAVGHLDIGRRAVEYHLNDVDEGESLDLRE